MKSDAVIDPSGRYRYYLSRKWRNDDKQVCFVMLNPSTADAFQDDPTIRRCIGFAQFWGFGSMVVVNLFAWRSTSPTDLKRASDPFGLLLMHYIKAAVQQSKMTVAAWGTHGGYLGQDRQVFPYLRNPVCLGVTKGGYPKHPLYVSGDTELIPYRLQPTSS